MRNSPCLLALAALLACAGARAESTAEKLTRIEAETAVLKATARQAEVQAQIASKHAEIANRRAEAQRNVPSSISEGPQLRGIEGMGDKLIATLELPHRGTVDVRAGDRLADGSRVLAVLPNAVELLTASRRRVRLAGGMGPATTQPAPAPAAEAPLPPPPPMDLPDLPNPRGVNR